MFWTICGPIVTVDPRVVLDASALLRLYLADGAWPEGLEEVLEGASRGEVVIFVPDLLYLEAASVLCKQVRLQLLSADQAKDLLHEIGRLPLRSVPASELKADALHAALAADITVYDAAYLALARRERARLFTVDLKLQKAAQTFTLDNDSPP
jgi:predicted nucleic acid-binding protein